MINHPVPLYKNTEDNTHCFQASLRMILKYFLPDKEFTWSELDSISMKVPEKWTWPMATLIWLSKQGFEIKNVEVFDYLQFIKKREAYLIEFYGEEVANIQIKNSDISQEIELSKEFVNKIETEVRVPTKDDIRGLLKQGFIMLCNVNSCTLDNTEGYSGHSIVVKGFDSESFFVNDPGAPALENKRVSFEIFEKAWAYPNVNAKNFIAIKI